MRRLVTFTVAVDIDESTFDVEPNLRAVEVDDFQSVVLLDVAQAVAREAIRVLAFHADTPTLADVRSWMSEAFDPESEPF